MRAVPVSTPAACSARENRYRLTRSLGIVIKYSHTHQVGEAEERTRAHTTCLRSLRFPHIICHRISLNPPNPVNHSISLTEYQQKIDSRYAIDEELVVVHETNANRCGGYETYRCL